MTLFELIARIKLEGAQETRTGLKGVSDEAKHTGDSAQKAGGGVDHMGGALKHLETASKIASGGLHGVVSVVGNLTGVLGRVVGIAGAAGGILGGIMGGSAVQVASDYADLQARLEAVTGSAAKAHEKLDFAQAVAGPSSYTFSQLAQATSLLETFGINAQRALPTMASLGMVFGATQDKMDVLIRGMGGLAQGKFFESDVSAAFGLNRAQFEAHGIKFDGQGQLLSSATDTFKALEAIVNSKYGTIFDKMQNLASTKAASLQDSWEKLERIIGNGIMTVAAPALERLSSVVNALGDSGVALDAVTRAVDSISRLTGGLGKGDGLTRFIAGAMSVLGNLPDAAGKVGTYLVGLFKVVENNIRSVFGLLMAEAVVLTTKIGNLLIGVIEQTASKIFRIPMEGMIGRLADPDEGILNVVRGMNKIQELPKFPKLNLLNQQQDYFERLTKAMKPSETKLPTATGDWLYNDSTSNPTSLLSKIATNTGKSADLLSLRAQATGPNAAGVVGPTAAEIQGGATRRIQIDTTGAENNLRKAIKEIAQEVIRALPGRSMNRRAIGSTG